ncbi:MAG: aminotransferase [Sulfitobacter sp.]
MNEKIQDLGRVQDWDARNVLHPWENTADLHDETRTFVESGDGIYVTTHAGKKLVDGPGGMWCCQIGHGRSEMGQAMADQANRLGYYSPFNNSNTAVAQLAQKIAARTPGDLNTVFFTTGGSTAVDSAIRFVQFRNNVLGRPDKKIIISRQKAYHGSTYLSASMSGKERDKGWMDVARELVHFLPDVNPFRRPVGMGLPDFLKAKVNDLEDAIVALGPNKVAAFIAEPILASGGVIVPPEGYHRACLEVCRKHDVLYISDEVVTGFGRLGHWFASDAVFGITPDIITCAKGMTSGYVPMGACIIADHLMDDIIAAGKDATFSNGYTYSGHPVSAAAALKTIEIIEREDILAHVREITPHFQARLHALRDFPLVVDTRGMGLVGCVECQVNPDGADPLAMDYDVGARIDSHCQALGLMVRPIINMCVVSPPLIITAAQIDEMFDMLAEGILRTTQDLTREGLWSPV